MFNTYIYKEYRKSQFLKTIAGVFIWVGIPVIMLMSVASLLEWNTVRSAEYKNAHSFIRQHKNF